MLSLYLVKFSTYPNQNVTQQLSHPQTNLRYLISETGFFLMSVSVIVRWLN